MPIVINDCSYCGRSDSLYRFDTVNRYHKLGGGSMIACACGGLTYDLDDYYDTCFANVPESLRSHTESEFLEMIRRWNELNKEETNADNDK